MARCDKNPEIDHREDVVNELLALCPDTLTTVVSLCIVWDGSGRERNWMSFNQGSFKVKGSLHLIHGIDVVRAVLQSMLSSTDQRWLLTDQRVYDW
ncbi:hypothetical protein NEOLEDRAFT_1213293 [Neolentinus lepideus HHB14362 ss-1]|uniref:Uncharacterized protein n=1 Tax=Neolentinus lepideus HHB14362 ss-1 TaxID=1314782 RepID=A0A165R6F7_9AGAM|nr:hypothetical protein NEOLEDRAFT_1213293 [Neolentinus lepideus HHB14362 ss-1]